MHVMHYFGDTMLTLIDQNAKMTHEKLAERVEAQLESPKLWKNFKANGLFDPGLAEWCYTPIIQSGGNYDLRPSAQSDDGKLKAGVILCSLGIRYKSYCSNMGRTFFIDPHKSQQDNYAFLCKLQSFVVEQLRDGVQFNAVYQATVDQIQEERPDLLPHFNKSMGFLVCIVSTRTASALTRACRWGSSSRNRATT
jgi:nucleosome binding factor SPN SPT16 subunit